MKKYYILIICEGSSGGGVKYTGSSLELDKAIAKASNDPEFLAFIMVIIGVIAVIGIAVLLLKLLVFNILIVGGRRFYIENQIKKASYKRTVALNN